MIFNNRLRSSLRIFKKKPSNISIEIIGYFGTELEGGGLFPGYFNLQKPFTRRRLRKKSTQSFIR